MVELSKVRKMRQTFFPRAYLVILLLLKICGFLRVFAFPLISIRFCVRLDMLIHNVLFFLVSVLLNTSLLFPNYSCVDLNFNSEQEFHSHRSIWDNRNIYSHNNYSQEARDNLVNNIYQKKHAIEIVQKMSLSEMVNAFSHIDSRNLFEYYHLYHIVNYRDYICSLPGYDDFIQELNYKLEHDHSFRKSLRYLYGFDGKYGFKDFVRWEAQRIRDKQVEQVKQETYRQELLHKQYLEEKRIKREAQEYALQLENVQELDALSARFAGQQKQGQHFCDQELLERYAQRICALNETIKNNGQLFDYSKKVAHFNFTDPYRYVFKHCCGTVLDKQLHRELCDTRTRATKFLSYHNENFQIHDLCAIVNYFTALAKEERNPIIAFNLSDFSYYLVQAAQGFGYATEIIFKGTARGVTNLVKHNLAFCQALVTHPVDDIVKPLAQAGIALGQALYKTVCLVKKDPGACSEKILSLTKNLCSEVTNDPEKAFSTVIELFLSFKATSMLKLHNIQGLTRFFSQQERVVRCLRGASEIVEKITVPIKHVVSEAASLVSIGLENGKTALKNLINVVKEQPEVVAISDIAALKLGPECYKDAAKLSKKIKNSFDFFGLKIRNIGDDILDKMELIGGHTLQKHVSLSDQYLINRARYEDIVAVTTFTNKRIAINAVKQNLRNNIDQIKEWFFKSDRDIKMFECSHKYPVGRGVLRKKKNIVRDLKKTTMILIKDDKSEYGFKILTCFPSIKK